MGFQLVKPIETATGARRYVFECRFSSRQNETHHVVESDGPPFEQDLSREAVQKRKPELEKTMAQN